MKFNEQQLKVINFHKGACAVISAAGSGKSSSLLHRIKTLVEIHNEKESDILAISFTRKTADELKNKLFKMGMYDVNVGTFHSICGKILAEEGSKINSQNLIKEWQVESCLKKIDNKVDTKDVMGFIGYQKNYLKSFNDNFVPKQSNYSEEELRIFFKAYEMFKKQQGLCDFDDYLVECYKLLKSNPGKYTFEFILVDEHQDSNLVQNMILKEWCKSGNICAFMDVRQSIYSFRAGNIEYAMNFEKDWKNAKTIHMETNYRSTKNIVEYANRFIKPYFSTYSHYSDAIPSNQDEGSIQLRKYDGREEEAIDIVDEIEQLISDGEKLSEIAVLYRLNSHSIYIENELRKRNIPYDITTEGSFFKRNEIMGIISFLRLLQNPHEDIAFENILKLRCNPLTFFSNKDFDEVRVSSGANNRSLYESFISYKFDKPWKNKNADIFEKNFNRLRIQNDKGISIRELIDNIIKTFKLQDYINDKYNSDEEREDRIKGMYALKKFVKGDDLDKFISYLDSNASMKRKAVKNSVKLMSAHSSKGLEWDNVFLVGVENEKFPHVKSKESEEARLWYVAVTRARKNMLISQIGEDNKFICTYFDLPFDEENTHKELVI